MRDDKCSVKSCQLPRRSGLQTCGGHAGGKGGNATGSTYRDGDTRLTPEGYVAVRRMQTRSRWVFQHREVMERLLRRPLGVGETVHHKNGIRTDNRPENLELWIRPQPAGQRLSDLIERYLPPDDPPFWAVMT